VKPLNGRSPMAPDVLTRVLGGSEEARKAVRYCLASAVSVAVSQAVLFVTFGPLHWPAHTANIVACAVATLPAYYLNRAWVWGKTGRSHVRREIMPFWVIAFLGLGLSTWAADFASANAHHLTTWNLGRTLVVMAATLGAFGLLWVGKFVAFNKVLFAQEPGAALLFLRARPGVRPHSASGKPRPSRPWP